MASPFDFVRDALGGSGGGGAGGGAAAVDQLNRPFTRTQGAGGGGAPNLSTRGRAAGRASGIVDAVGGTEPGLSRAENALRELLKESFTLNEQNTANRRGAEGFLQGQFDENTKPTITESDITNLFAQQSDLLAGDFLANNRAISESIGIRGVTGGVAADLAAQSQASFQQALAQSKGNIRIAKMRQDAEDSMRNLNAAFSLGNFLAAPEDETALAGLGAFVEGTTGIASIRAQAKAASEAADAAETSAWLGLAGDIVGGALLL